eukprot:GHVS01041237.1.p1 GENE.GHVS01041237.1~~GHVS01041237.1.p1  ORF type:complete len:786 (+),score=96.59 GHVS01041237.1:138-2495(+)
MPDLIDPTTLPSPGRIIRGSADCSYPQASHTYLSIAQSIRNLSTSTPDFFWTADVRTELPIKLSESGAGSYPPATIVEVFADIVCRCPTRPALGFKQHALYSPFGVTDGNEDEELAGGVSTNTTNKANNRRTADTDNTNSATTAGSTSSLSSGGIIPSFLSSSSSKWQYLTWQSYWTEICRFSKSLLSLGFDRRDRVVIMGYNSPAWSIAYFGTIFCDGIVGGIYATNGVDATAYIVEHSEAIIAVVDGRENLEKILKSQHNKKSRSSGNGTTSNIQQQLLKAIVVYGEPPPEGYASERVVEWQQFMRKGVNVADSQLTQRMETQRPGNCCSLVYTSGTTGPPKAAMLTQDNFCWTGWNMTRLVDLTVDDRIVSYLPLSHISSQLMDLFVHLFCGGCVYFAKPDALQGSLVETLKEVRPTWFFTVPRVWEKFEEKLKEAGAQNSRLTKAIGEWAKRVGYDGTYAHVVSGQTPPLGYSLAKNLILTKIHKALGLDQTKAFGTGAAPLPVATQRYFMSLGIPICDLFGLSETTGPMTATLPLRHWYRVGSVGHALPGAEAMVYNPSSDGVGELCFRGRNIFMGYYKNSEATRQSIDSNGFLHTGDIGYIDGEGFVYITGRIKELIITAGGENVAPVLIESIVAEEMPFISNSQVIGDGRRFICLLICLRSVPDSTSKPTNNLAEQTVQLLETRGATARTTYEAATDHVMNQIIFEGVQRVNKRCPSRAQHIRKWRIVPQDFTIDGGELTPTMKLKRPIVIEKYAQLIEEMYAEKLTDYSQQNNNAKL